MIGDFGGGDIDTRELLDVALDENEPPEVRRTAREGLAAKLTHADLVELIDGWEIHADFGGVSVERDLRSLGVMVKAYEGVAEPDPTFYTDLATAIGEDFRSHLQAIAEKLAEEGSVEAGDPIVVA
ncbi:MAG: hypothetical protein ACODAE_06875 [Gemmatimonadota bacterium]